MFRKKILLLLEGRMYEGLVGRLSKLSCEKSLKIKKLFILLCKAEGDDLSSFWTEVAKLVHSGSKQYCLHSNEISSLECLICLSESFFSGSILGWSLK